MKITQKFLQETPNHDVIIFLLHARPTSQYHKLTNTLIWGLRYSLIWVLRYFFYVALSRVWDLLFGVKNGYDLRKGLIYP